MKILMTGGSSFTGFWFAKTLAERGHLLTLTFTKGINDYTGLRRARVNQLCQVSGINTLWNYKFGSDEFIELLNKKFDIVCHHGAYVEDYKSLQFNALEATEQNTHQCDKIVSVAKQQGVKKIILSGSVFEANEGKGSLPLVPFSPYGLSKTFTWELFRFWAWKYDLSLTKFVIPNPFGPYEEPRFCNYLIQSWIKGATPCIKTPDYIRDNIHVDLLAGCYGVILEKEIAGIHVANPSGYIETQREFALRFAREIGNRLKIKTAVDFAKQENFDEPLERVNTTAAISYYNSWKETAAWDNLADYYQQVIERTIQLA
jgi:UDP-glucose 4-epimerase